MNVLSLFDGMSCGQIALERAGIKVNNYFASEIDKYGQIVSKANYPNTIYLGDVRHINSKDLPKIDLIIGGSPCQSFSFAGKRKGMSTKDEQQILTLEHYLQLKSEGFEFEGQSYLFWEYMRLLNECNPKYFLLENVEMGEKWERVLSKAIGVNGIHINSALLSAQNRKRIYWTNIGMKPSGLFGDLESIIQQPKDKGILLKYILENEVDNKYFLTDKAAKRINSYNNSERSLNDTGKSLCLAAGYFKQGRDNQLVVDNTILKSLKTIKSEIMTLTGNDKISISGGDFRHDEGYRWRNNGKSGCLAAQAREDGTGGNALVKINTSIRRLTPIECERLQTVPDNYTNHVSDSQRYKMLGNGWTIDVISHLFNYI